MKKLLLLVGMLWANTLVMGQDKNDAFIYIQGDKQTPIYVKMEGEMQARYSKDFVILNGLASGPLHLEVLFQQNAYPAQKFILNIPESGQRAFILKKVDNGQFALYDLNSGHYVTAGNQLEDDVITVDPNKDLQELVAARNEDPVAVLPEQGRQTKEEGLPDFPQAKEKPKKTAPPKKTKPVKTKPEPVADTPVVAEMPQQPVTEAPKEERFLNFELEQKNKEASQGTERRRNRKENNTEARAEEKPVTPAKAVSATCTEGMDEVHFNNFAQQLSNRTDEETRLSYIIKYGKNYCFTTEQVRIVAMGFTSQSSRYEVARVLKPKVVDVDQYELLLSLFNTNYLKQRFAKEVIGTK